MVSFEFADGRRSLGETFGFLNVQVEVFKHPGTGEYKVKVKGMRHLVERRFQDEMDSFVKSLPGVDECIGGAVLHSVVTNHKKSVLSTDCSCRRQFVDEASESMNGVS